MTTTFLPAPSPDSNGYSPAEFDSLLHQLADVAQVPYVQLKHVIENMAITQARPRREAFVHLRGQLLTISQAAKKYKTLGTTLRDWTDKGYIAVLDNAHPKKLDEADVAFCVAVKAQRKKLGITKNIPFFDAAGQPVYEVKFADRARARRETLV